MSFWMIYDMIFLLAGCYGLSLCAKVGMSGDLQDIKLLLPRNVKLDECLDAAGFIRKIRPWMVIFSASVVLNGGVGMVEDMKLGLPHMVHMVTLGLCLAAAVVFFIMLRRAAEEFWEQEDEED